MVPKVGINGFGRIGRIVSLSKLSFSLSYLFPIELQS